MNKITASAALAVSFAALMTGGADAQSIYGMIYTGELFHSGSGRQQALGHSAVAVQDTSSAVTSNPSSTADLSMVTLTIHQQLGASRIYYLESVSRQTRYQLPAFMASLPIRKGLVMSIGYRTRYFGKADFAYIREIEGAPTALETYKLNSSLFMLPLVLAWKPLGTLRIAGEAQFNLGSIIDKVSVSFDDDDYRSADSKRQRNYSGLSWGASMLWEAHRRLWLGCYIDGAVNYSVDEDIENTRSELDTESSFDYTLPLAWDAGLAANVYKRWWVSFSYSSRSASDPAGFPQLEGAVGDETHIGIGVERRMNDSGHALSRIPLRLGFYRDKWHIEFPPGQEVAATFFTIGSAIPFGKSPGAIDYSIEFGQIGSRDRNLVEEKVLRFGISVSVSEPWSRRRTERH